ncbi:Uncharacterised protein [Vibrio cholerae]|nr:Uncharacterised protein [Vibrio cholerae]
MMAPQPLAKISWQPWKKLLASTYNSSVYGIANPVLLHLKSAVLTMPQAKLMS